MTKEESALEMEANKPSDICGHYQPVHLEDTVGAIFLGVIALICLIGWRRSETRFWKLLTKQEQGIQTNNA